MFHFSPTENFRKLQFFWSFEMEKNIALVLNGFITSDNFLTDIGLTFSCLPTKKGAFWRSPEQKIGSISVKCVEVNELMCF